MSRPNLNEKQQAVYHCIINAMAEGLPPTVREICAATGIKSTSTVHAVLKKLEEAGNHTAYEQVMAAVSDFEKGNMRLSVVLSSLAE